MLLFYGVLKVLKVLKVLFCNNKTGPPSQASRSFMENIINNVLNHLQSYKKICT